MQAKETNKKHKNFKPTSEYKKENIILYFCIVLHLKYLHTKKKGNYKETFFCWKNKKPNLNFILSVHVLFTERKQKKNLNSKKL